MSLIGQKYLCGYLSAMTIIKAGNDVYQYTEKR